jgi:hypothetical protein
VPPLSDKLRPEALKWVGDILHALALAPRRRIFKWTASIACLTVSAAGGIWFASSLASAIRARNAANLTCARGAGVVNNGFTYIQIDLLDQHPIEPYFNATLFVNLGTAYGKQPTRIIFTRSAGRSYAQSTVNVDLVYDADAQNLWATKQTDFSLIRTAGAHRDFPFDRAKFDFDLTYTPPGIPVNNFLVRNHNPSFDLDCETYSVQRLLPGKVHISFDVRRNPLVLVTAIVLIGAGCLFLIGIVGFAKSEALPTSIASFFFSLWSIRAILSSEMKTFPTDLDLAILSLCVLLIVALGIRLALREIPKRRQAS